jgi:hypothetical protein
MHFLAAVILFPLLVWLLSCGCGLLVERLTGTCLPALLVLPLGFGGIVVVSQFTLWLKLTAPLTPFVLVVLALVGAALSREELRSRWRQRARGWWTVAAPAIAAYLIVAAPVIASGRLTFTGYLIDTTGAVQIAGGEWLLHHGHDFSNTIPSYGAMLSAYFGHGYPYGGQGVLASIGWLSGEDLIWLYSLFQAVELGLLALVLAYLAVRSGLSRWAATATGTIAAVPALVCAYALMGSVKELTALPMLALLGALPLCVRELRPVGIRAILPFAIAASAALAAIGIAATPWIALFALVWLVLAVPVARRSDLVRLGVVGLGLAVSVALVALPTVGRLTTTLKLAEGVSNADPLAVSDPGNLLRPLKFIQVFGVWLGETHRLDPKYVNQTYILMGVVGVCVVLGLVWLVRRRAWGVLAFVAGSLVVWDFLHHHATIWTDAKLLVILSPVVVFVALVGAFGLMSTRRVEGLVLAIALTGGILASDALLYHGTNLAPTQRFSELSTIDASFSGQGPTLVPDFEEYTLYLLRNMKIDSPGLAYRGNFSFVGGASHIYGHSYDIDSLALPSVERFRTIVVRRSPAWSRPPGNFSLVWSGRYYTVWRRNGPPPRIHVPLGAGYEPSAVPSCRAIAGLARRARQLGAPLTFAPRPSNISVDLSTVSHTPLVAVSADLEGRPELVALGPARIEGRFRVAATGRYELWLGGDTDRPLRVMVDRHTVGVPSAQSGDDGTMIDVATLKLTAGRHSFQLLRGGGDLRPDDAGSTVIDGVVLEALTAQRGLVQTVGADRWRSLCGRHLDWLEMA